MFRRRALVKVTSALVSADRSFFVQSGSRLQSQTASPSPAVPPTLQPQPVPTTTTPMMPSSGTSINTRVSLTKQPCPYCGAPHTLRYMDYHIATIHPFVDTTSVTMVSHSAAADADAETQAEEVDSQKGGDSDSVQVGGESSSSHHQLRRSRHRIFIPTVDDILPFIYNPHRPPVELIIILDVANLRREFYYSKDPPPVLTTFFRRHNIVVIAVREEMERYDSQVMGHFAGLAGAWRVVPSSSSSTSQQKGGVVGGGGGQKGSAMTPPPIAQKAAMGKFLVISSLQGRECGDILLGQVVHRIMLEHKLREYPTAADDALLAPSPSPSVKAGNDALSGASKYDSPTPPPPSHPKFILATRDRELINSVREIHGRHCIRHFSFSGGIEWLDFLDVLMDCLEPE